MMINTTLSRDATTFPAEFSPIVVTREVPATTRISFFPRVLVHHSLSRSDLTATEVQTAWYSADELKMIKRSCRMFATQLSKRTADDGNNTVCFRGLEGKTMEGLQRRKMIKLNARNAVILEQHRQQKMGIVDGDRLAYEYFQCTGSSSAAAHMVALLDQKEAMDIHNEALTTKTMETTKSINGTDIRRKAMDMYTRSDSMRSLKRLASLSSTRRLISDAIFKA
mmetsp:Transcript_8549/g.21073  ORF Transcript_8549/g.21073 Transcript_8549/m.21073 type:complete len:224 (+) Transcript_8549:118-789(+)|eukprot:CAMPEP_0172393942 /NCGR_PEP_ID=MMETSP1061-20121228/12511_1 /TAXON_ID=37318 /ORGANISM="Pseudo-nitzschia pungens, Strain cf. pungens" /LENGTH=223 /DNA_ID=CAMNT_0013125169 /DNA_START=46 /DNA_END=717 /DNA_ORIENTATION=-